VRFQKGDHPQWSGRAPELSCPIALVLLCSLFTAACSTERRAKQTVWEVGGEGQSARTQRQGRVSVAAKVDGACRHRQRRAPRLAIWRAAMERPIGKTATELRAVSPELASTKRPALLPAMLCRPVPCCSGGSAWRASSCLVRAAIGRARMDRWATVAPGHGGQPRLRSP